MQYIILLYTGEYSIHVGRYMNIIFFLRLLSPRHGDRWCGPSGKAGNQGVREDDQLLERSRKSGGRCGLIASSTHARTHRRHQRRRLLRRRRRRRSTVLQYIYNVLLLYSNTNTHTHTTICSNILHIAGTHTRGSWHVPGRWFDSRHVLHVHHLAPHPNRFAV